MSSTQTRVAPVTPQSAAGESWDTGYGWACPGPPVRISESLAGKDEAKPGEGTRQGLLSARKRPLRRRVSDFGL